MPIGYHILAIVIVTIALTQIIKHSARVLQIVASINGNRCLQCGYPLGNARCAECGKLRTDQIAPRLRVLGYPFVAICTSLFILGAVLILEFRHDLILRSVPTRWIYHAATLRKLPSSCYLTIECELERRYLHETLESDLRADIAGVLIKSWVAKDWIKFKVDHYGANRFLSVIWRRMIDSPGLAIQITNESGQSLTRELVRDNDPGMSQNDLPISLTGDPLACKLRVRIINGSTKAATRHELLIVVDASGLALVVD